MNQSKTTTGKSSFWGSIKVRKKLTAQKKAPRKRGGRTSSCNEKMSKSQNKGPRQFQPKLEATSSIWPGTSFGTKKTEAQQGTKIRSLQVNLFFAAKTMHGRNEQPESPVRHKKGSCPVFHFEKSTRFQNKGPQQFQPKLKSTTSIWLGKSSCYSSFISCPPGGGVAGGVLVARFKGQCSGALVRTNKWT